MPSLPLMVLTFECLCLPLNISVSQYLVIQHAPDLKFKSGPCIQLQFLSVILHESWVFYSLPADSFLTRWIKIDSHFKEKSLIAEYFIIFQHISHSVDEKISRWSEKKWEEKEGGRRKGEKTILQFDGKQIP